MGTTEGQQEIDIAEKKGQAPDIHSSTDEYAARFAGEVGKWFLDVQLKGTFHALGEEDVDTILDVGGGHGQTAAGLLDRGVRLEILGSDESCSRRLEPFRDNPNFSFTTGKLTGLPYENGSFDVSLSYRMMTHLDDWQGLVRELCRVATRLVIVDYPTFRSANVLSEVLFAVKKKVEKNTRQYHVFHEAEVIEEFRRCGYALCSRYPQFFLPMALHRAHKNRKLAELLEGAARTTGLSSLFASPVIACFKKMN